VDDFFRGRVSRLAYVSVCRYEEYRSPVLYSCGLPCLKGLTRIVEWSIKACTDLNRLN